MTREEEEMIIHIPHSRIEIPDGYSFPVEEINRMTDWYVDELFAFPQATSIIFPYTRLFCDVERFTTDEMDSVGMGICYTKKSDGTRLRTVLPQERDSILKNHYFPHHRKLQCAVDEELKGKGSALIVDAHSFPAIPLPYETDENRPDICLGMNENTPSELADAVKNFWAEKGYRVSCNSPFSGTMVPIDYQGNKRVKSIMIEINRGLYLNGTEKSGGYHSVKRDIYFLLSKLQHD